MKKVAKMRLFFDFQKNLKKVGKKKSKIDFFAYLLFVEFNLQFDKEWKECQMLKSTTI